MIALAFFSRLSIIPKANTSVHHFLADVFFPSDYPSPAMTTTFVAFSEQQAALFQKSNNGPHDLGVPLQAEQRIDTIAAPSGEGDGRRSEGIFDGSVDADAWVVSQVDPFLSALRQVLLRDRPADIPAAASAFSADWQRNNSKA